MANTVQVTFEIDKDQQGRTVLRQIDRDMDKIGKTAQQTGTGIDNALKFLRAAVIIEFFRRGIAAAIDFGQEAVAAFNRARAAALGLQAVAQFRGVDSQSAQDQLKNLQIVRDGLLSFSDASLALQNLLQRGFGLDQSLKLLQAFGDSAAFNRQQALTFGQAVVSTSEGIKNLNSILSDNGGITKNLSVILRERGFELQDLDDKIKGAAAREALYQGLLVETAAQSGNASKLARTFAGEQSRLEVQQRRLLEATGQLITSNPELNDALKTVSDTVEFLALQLRDSESLLSQFIDDTVSRVSTLVEVVAKLTNNIGPLLKILDLTNTGVNLTLDTLSPGSLFFGDPRKPTDEEKNVKLQFDKVRELYLKEQKKLAEERERQKKEQPILDKKAIEEDRKAFQQLRAEGERALKELEEKNKRYRESVQGAGDAVDDLAKRLSVNPIAQLYDEALRRQRDFLERFKEVPQAIKDAFVKANQDVLRLDLFKAQLGQAGQINNLVTEIAKLEAGLGGKTDLSEFDQSRLARIQREALDAQLRTAQGFLAQATNPAQRQLALEQILGATQNISGLTSDQVQIRLKALTDSLAIQQQVFKENFDRVRDQLNAQKDNTAALVAVGNRLSTVEGALTNFAQQPITIAIENETSARVDVGKANPGLKE